MNLSDISQTDLAFWLQSQKASSPLEMIVCGLASSCVHIDTAVQAAALGGTNGASGTINVQGEEQKELDIITNDIVLAHLDGFNQIAAFVSEEIEDLIVNQNADQGAKYVICFDPLDGSSNIETNGAIGTIFSILELDQARSDICAADVLAAANNQVAAGYVIYGPATILVVTTGKSVASFVLDKQAGQFVAEKTGLEIIPAAAEYAINTAYTRFWEPALATYIAQCDQGKSGPRNKDFGMRWMGAMVSDVHRLFIRGGIFIYPGLAKPGGESGKLRFLYEANPMAMLVEVAGGKAFMRTTRILEHKPDNIHQRVPVVLGSSEEVDELLAQYRR